VLLAEDDDWQLEETAGATTNVHDEDGTE